MDKKILMIVTAFIAAVLLAAAGYSFVTQTSYGKKIVGNTTITPAEAKTRMQSFVKDGLGVPENIEFSVADPVKEAGVYKSIVTIQKKDYPMYLSLDGSAFFPNAITDDVLTKAKESASATPEPAQEIPKSPKPEVKLFVMSYCPYGTQIEKGILPVIEALGNKIDYTLEFVSYAMHDKKELDENLRQYCIRTEEPTKLSAYLGCFLKKGQGTETECLKTTGVNATKNTACMLAADTKFEVTKNFNDKETYQGSYPPFNVDKADNEKYAIQGSPTLVINGITADSQRDSASLLKTICGAFETSPAECDKTLSTTAPSAGFGEGTAAASGASAGAACGS